jgi:hypothetical protein
MTEEWKAEGGKWKIFFPFSLYLFPLTLKKSKLKYSTKLNLPSNFLISLIIKLTNPVDKAVDKLWISCG